MSRHARVAPGGHLYHVLNRTVGRMKMFRFHKDFLAFERLIHEAHERHPIRILSYCIMPTHWHFVVWPRRDGDVTAFFRWLSHTHAMRWRVAHHTVGYGHLYQDRFKSFLVQPDGPHLRSVCRYVERNALTAGEVRRAEAWRWGSLWVRSGGGDAGSSGVGAAGEQTNQAQRALLSDWPEPIPADWIQRVNAPLNAKEVERLQVSMKRSRPFGDDRWMLRTASRFGLEHTLRREGRPRKSPKQKGQQAKS
jgi:putative transposase